MTSKLPPKATNVGEGPSKAKWNDTNTKVFLKVCVEEIEAGNRPHAHFTKEGWNNIVEKFNKETGYKYGKKQIKNRWDALKQEFSMWARLVEKETVLGWDPVKQTVIASPEWWATKGGENPKYLNWKDQGPKFLALMERCFKEVVATGYYVHVTPRNPVSHKEQNDQNVSDDVVSHATEGEGDADQHPLDDINETPGVSNNLQRKRKRGRQGDKRVEVALGIQNSVDRLVDSINEALTTAIPRRPYDHYSVARCVTLLNTIPGLERNSPLFFLASRIMRDKINREMFVTFMETSPDSVIPWLKTFTMEEARNYK